MVSGFCVCWNRPLWSVQLLPFRIWCVGPPAVPGDGPVASGDDRTAPGKEESVILWRRVLFGSVVDLWGSHVPLAATSIISIPITVTGRVYASVGWVWDQPGGIAVHLVVCSLWESGLWLLMGRLCVFFTSFWWGQKEKGDWSWTNQLMLLLRMKSMRSGSWREGTIKIE